MNKPCPICMQRDGKTTKKRIRDGKRCFCAKCGYMLGHSDLNH